MEDPPHRHDHSLPRPAWCMYPAARLDHFADHSDRHRYGVLANVDGMN